MREPRAGSMAGPAAGNRVGAVVRALRVLGGAALADIGEGWGGGDVGAAMVAVGRVHCERCCVVSPQEIDACRRPDRLGRALEVRLEPRVLPRLPAPTSIGRGSDEPYTQKWVPNVGTSCIVAQNVDPTHATDPHLTCRRSLLLVA